MWQTRLHAIILPIITGRLLEILSSYLWCQACPVLGVFYLLCKTHKSCAFVNGRWSARPVVGLHTWATTTTLVILGVAGTILLKLDQSFDEMSTPLRDSMDLVQCVNSLSKLNNWHEYVVSSFDFHSMCTNINWSNAHNAYLFFKGWFESTPDLTTDLTHGEIALLRFLFSQLRKEVWDEHCIHLS